MDKKEYFNDKAVGWDNLLEDEVKTRIRNMIKELALAPGSTVLDLGTGTGVLIPMLIEAVGSSGFVTAVDFAPKMLVEARKKFKWPNLIFLEGDAEDIPLEDQAVDEVVCNSAFPHFNDFRQAAQEMCRVLKSGGRVTVFHPHNSEYINNLHQSLGGAVRNCLLPEEDEMYAIFSNAGFVNITLADVSQRYILTARKSHIKHEGSIVQKNA